MAQKELERFYLRILFKYTDKEGYGGAEIAYIYNRESLDELNIKKHSYDESQFIELGDELTLNGNRVRVKSINFKLDKQIWDMSGGYGINMYSPTDPTDFNCQVGVFVESI